MRIRLLRKAFLAVCLTTISLLLASDASAQYFGRNKVRYDKFDYEILHTRHFDIYYYPEEQRAINDAARMAERWYLRHARVFGDTLSERQPLLLYGSHPQFRQTNVIGNVSVGTGGVTESARRRVLMPFAGSLQETDHVLGHELVHAYQYDLAGEREDRNSMGLAGFARLPLWFVEGMAEYLSVGADDPNTAMWMRDAIANDRLPDLGDLESPEFFPYRYGQALLAYIGGRWGDRAVAELFMSASYYGDIRSAIDTVFKIKADTLIANWHLATHQAFDSLVTRTQPPESLGVKLISEDQGGTLNIAPALSPDGNELVFFSERGLLSINLYLADARTGEVKRTILHTELDPHFQGLDFINGAGAWNPDGTRFLFSAVSEGRPFLSILNVRTGDIEREIRFEELGEIFSPTWSPDGQRIAFSALASGVTDLFVYDLSSDETARLTDDSFADLQPSWSPDGNRIVFSTDRFTTRLATLEYEGYHLALIDPDSRAIQRLQGPRGNRNFNPQWSADGRSIYFLSDPDGITNIYRLNVADGTVARITNVFTGVSGITALSPALTVAARTNRIAFSVFDEGGYNIFTIDSSAVLAGIPSRISEEARPSSLLPPYRREGSIVMKQLATPRLGLPTDTMFATSDYRPTLGLEGIIQPTAAVGVDRFGTYGGGGIALLWGDMLGNQSLTTALQIQSGGGYTDILGLVGYINTSGRLNWGGAVQQVPYNYGTYRAGTTDVNGERAYVAEEIIYRQINRDVTGILSYPFSEVMRLDFNFTWRNIIFRVVQNQEYYSLTTGLPITTSSENLPNDPALNLGIASLALVFDNSIYGATSPVLGQRWRFEVSPMIGSLKMNNLLADYRAYVMPLRPITIAGRLLHFGRYGASADDERISPLFLGYPGLVRGYQASTFSASNWADGNGYQFDRLVGSKAVIANFELRFPLFGILGLGKGYYGWLPVEFGGFYDTGVAWSNATKPTFLGGGNKPVSSTGLMLRMNLFGFAIGELDYVRPLNHPEKNWQWLFTLSEGF